MPDGPDPAIERFALDFGEIVDEYADVHKLTQKQVLGGLLGLFGWALVAVANEHQYPSEKREALRDWALACLERLDMEEEKHAAFPHNPYDEGQPQRVDR